MITNLDISVLTDDDNEALLTKRDHLERFVISVISPI
jgi:hypothetical protein